MNPLDTLENRACRIDRRPWVFDTVWFVLAVCGLASLVPVL